MTTPTPEGPTREGPNAELAYSTLDHIRAHPDQHRQVVWLRRPAGYPAPTADTGWCGTSGCFAGWVSLLAGDQPVRGDAHFGWEWVDEVRTPDGRHAFVAERAVELLRISQEQADQLFDAVNSVADLERLVREFFGPRPASVPVPAEVGGGRTA